MIRVKLIFFCVSSLITFRAVKLLRFLILGVFSGIKVNVFDVKEGQK